MPYTCQKPANEVENSITRSTIDGRKIIYRLRVLQQPERARACGAGARSSADRRPVDPPPVVELVIWEDDGEKVTDITFAYNASFFLFATLEVARPIANGRMHNAPVIPVLTGVPVAATNYLDRPQQAGYFIFPDLSVRHEGFYRLVFNLYEATKDPEDADRGRPFVTAVQENQSSEPKPPQAHEDMALRLEVRSTPFQVFSAKKFPGLAESTQLSRLVADQGCRVRIRRDVRMRKRGEGRKDEFDLYDDAARSMNGAATPDSAFPPPTPIIDRGRSVSHSSPDGSQYGSDYRRSSMETGYQPHLYSSVPTALNSRHGSFSMPVPPVSTPPITPQYPNYGLSSMTGPQQTAPGYPPLSQWMPHDRRYHDGEGLSSAHRVSDTSQYYMTLPNPGPAPTNITPDTTRQRVDLPPIDTVRDLNGNSAIASYDSARSRWQIPESRPATKRSHSPLSTQVQQSLKGGRRPSPNPNPDAGPSQGIFKWTANGIEPDGDPYSTEQEHQEIGRNLMMNYRRADGHLSRKHIPYSPANIPHSPPRQPK